MEIIQEFIILINKVIMVMTSGVMIVMSAVYLIVNFILLQFAVVKILKQISTTYLLLQSGLSIFALSFSQHCILIRGESL